MPKEWTVSCRCRLSEDEVLEYRAFCFSQWWKVLLWFLRYGRRCCWLRVWEEEKEDAG